MMNDMNSDSEREESFDFFDEELIKQIFWDSGESKSLFYKTNIIYLNNKV